MRQNLKSKQTLESAQYGLEIIFNKGGRNWSWPLTRAVAGKASIVYHAGFKVYRQYVRKADRDSRYFKPLFKISKTVLTV